MTTAAPADPLTQAARAASPLLSRAPAAVGTAKRRVPEGIELTPALEGAADAWRRASAAYIKARDELRGAVASAQAAVRADERAADVAADAGARAPKATAPALIGALAPAIAQLDGLGRAATRREADFEAVLATERAALAELVRERRAAAIETAIAAVEAAAGAVEALQGTNRAASLAGEDTVRVDDVIVQLRAQGAEIQTIVEPKTMIFGDLVSREARLSAGHVEA
jgi:hypothetical protein